MGYLSLMLLAGVVVTAHRAQGTKQVGETCGSCFNPEANFDCGKCVPGLECVKEYKVKYFVKDDESDLLPDLPSRCRVTLVFPRGGEVGDDCGPCFNPSANFDCGECRPGLECGATNPLLPDAPGKCQFARPPIPSGDARCNGKNCGDTCGMGMRQMPAPNAPDGVAICNSKGECSTDFDNLGCEKDPKGALWEQGYVSRPVHYGRIVFYRKQGFAPNAPATNVATAPSKAN